MAQVCENTSHCTVVWNTNVNREKLVTFDRAISGKFIKLDHADIPWNYNNLRGTERDNNYVYTDDGSGMDKLILPDGYYTFDAIAEKVKEGDITLTYDPNTLLSKIETKLPLRLWRLGRLLGFENEKEILANSSATSTNMVNINDGLQIISVICDKVNSSKNFFNTFNGNRTQVLWSFCTPIEGKNIDRLSFKCSAEIGWIVLNFRIHN